MARNMMFGDPYMGSASPMGMAQNVPQRGIQPMQSQQMFTGAPTGGGGALGQLANTQAQQIQNPANAQRVAGMLRGAGRMFNRF